MSYTKQQKEEMFDRVIDYISNGMSLRSAISQEDVFSRTVWDELIKEEDKKTRYTCAREERADAIFEDLIKISDNLGGDLITLKDGREVVDNAVIARDKLRVDTRKWMLSKMQPKKYGDKTEVDLTTKGESLNDISQLTTEELVKRAEAVKKLKNE